MNLNEMDSKESMNEIKVGKKMKIGLWIIFEKKKVSLVVCYSKVELLYK